MDGQPIQTLAALRDNNPAIRLQAVEAIAAEPAEIQDFVCDLLHAAADTNESVRLAAIGALDSLSPTPDKIPKIIRSMQRPADSEVVYWGSTLIGRAGVAGAEAVPTLTGIVANSSFLHVREKAAWALGQIGPSATGAIAVLESAAEQGPSRLQRIAATALESVQRTAA